MNSKSSITTRSRRSRLSGAQHPSSVERDRWQVSVMVWAAIIYDGTSILERINGNLNLITFLDILKKRLLRNLPALRNSSSLDPKDTSLLLQQDNSRIHTAKIIKAYFEDSDIYVLPWPSKSSNLNLIENALSMLKGGLQESYGAVQN